MNIDERLCNLPLVGWILRRMYSYFEKHIAFTDAIHIALGLGIGLIIVGDQWKYVGVIALAIGILGHLYAFFKGAYKV